MANINHKPSKYMLNLLHVLPPFVDEAKGIVNTIVEINAGTLNKYELITESGTLKLDRVGYSSLTYPVAYGAIPRTLDEDGDAIDVLIANLDEPLPAGCLVEARIIGIMKFVDGGEVDDKIITVLNDDKRTEHITKFEQLGDHTIKEIQHFFEHYKDLKKPGTCEVKGFFDTNEALKTIKKCAERYESEYASKLD
jgi:inorganic pyrophosphatase